MSSSVLQLFTLLVLVLAAYGDKGSCSDDGLNHLLSENDGDIKGVHIDRNCTDGLNHLLSENNGDIKRIHLDDSAQHLDDRTITKPTTSSQIFSPTPPPIATPDPVVIAGQTPPKKPAVDAVTKPIPILTTTPRPIEATVALPPAAPTESASFVPICGKKGNCYQWFDDQFELVVDGYKRCNRKDERRAKRYCCITDHD